MTNGSASHAQRKASSADSANSNDRCDSKNGSLSAVPESPPSTINSLLIENTGLPEAELTNSASGNSRFNIVSDHLQKVHREGPLRELRQEILSNARVTFRAIQFVSAQTSGVFDNFELERAATRKMFRDAARHEARYHGLLIKLAAIGSAILAVLSLLLPGALILLATGHWSIALVVVGLSLLGFLIIGIMFRLLDRVLNELWIVGVLLTSSLGLIYLTSREAMQLDGNLWHFLNQLGSVTSGNWLATGVRLFGFGVSFSLTSSILLVLVGSLILARLRKPELPRCLALTSLARIQLALVDATLFSDPDTKSELLLEIDVAASGLGSVYREFENLTPSARALARRRCSSASSHISSLASWVTIPGDLTRTDLARETAMPLLAILSGKLDNLPREAESMTRAGSTVAVIARRLAAGSIPFLAVLALHWTGVTANSALVDGLIVFAVIWMTICYVSLLDDKLSERLSTVREFVGIVKDIRSIGK